MPRNDLGLALRGIERLFRDGTFAGVSDAELMERFLNNRGDSAEAAFSALVERHGSMVLRVAQRVLRDRHDAEDVFQATFLALARSAHAVKKRESVESWLFGAALRIASRLRVDGVKRRVHEGRWAVLRASTPIEEPTDDLGSVVLEEVARLPAAYRSALLLCDLQGLSLIEAARRLNLPIGTVKSRAFRGRERLKSRLARRGFAPTAGVVATILTSESFGSVRVGLNEATVRACRILITARSSVEILASTVGELAIQESRRWLMGRWRTLAFSMTTAGALAVGATSVAFQDQPRVPSTAVPTQPVEIPTGQVITARAYAVSDLVSGPRFRPNADPKPLIEMITSSIAPGTWHVDDESRPPVRAQPKHLGSMLASKDQTLYMTHSQATLDEVGRFLDQLRKVLRVRDAHEVVEIEVDQNNPFALTRATTVPTGTQIPRPSQPSPDVKPSTPADRAPANNPPIPAPTPLEGSSGSGIRRFTTTPAAPTLTERVPAAIDTERRLRDLETKLDRVLKALEAPKPVLTRP